MMKFTITLGILWLTICSLQFKATAQNFKQTIDFADKQYLMENYQLAVKEYQRALFFSKGDSLDYLYRKIAFSFYANRQFEQAAYFFELSYHTAKVDSLKYEILFNKIQCHLLSENYNKAIVELHNFPTNLRPYFEDKRNFYSAISHFGAGNFKDSETYFLKLIDENDAGKQNKITTLFRKKKYLYKPNPKTAKILSIILPGAGQMYAGDVKNSFNSLLLTGGFVALGVFLAQEYTYLDATLTSLPWFMRYHKGGYSNAYKLAQKKRAVRRNKTYKKILKIVQEN